MSARASRERVAITLAVCMCSASAHADDDVTVHGTESAGFSSRANVEDAPREITDAASLVEPLPGVHLRRLGADDAFSTLSIRGSSSNEVSVVLAGVPLTDAADPTLDLGSLPLWPDASARVYRSFTPAVEGHGSLGGTLVLDPPRAFGPTKTEVWSAVGSFGAARMRASDREKIDFGNRRDVYVTTALSASRADDNFSYFDGKSDVERENAGHAAVNGLVSVALPIDWTAQSHGTVQFTTIAQARRQELPGTTLAPTPNALLESSRLLHSIELSGPAASGAWHVGAWGRHEESVTRSPNDPYSPAHGADGVTAAGARTGWRGKLTDDLTLATDADASGERFAPGTAYGGTQDLGATRTLAGLGADLDWRATSIWTWSASGRADLWHDASDDPSLAASTSGTEAHPTGHLGSELAVGPVTFAAHGGAVARPASFVERYGSRGTFLGDPTLQTETAWVADIGARTSWKRGIFRGHAELTGFSTWADNLIIFLPVGALGRPKATNVGRARLLGSEADLALFIADFSLDVSYTYLHTANESDGVCSSVDAIDGCARPPLPSRPQHDLVSDLSYRAGPLTLRYGIDVVAGMFYDQTGSIPIPARVLHSAGARFDVPHVRGLRLALDVHNLFDLRTGEYAGGTGPVALPIGDSYNYPIPGRSFLFSVRYVTER
ncbi:MAG: TonB-dependent receptor plug domain-containing protein [Polyangiaceae bacterium]